MELTVPQLLSASLAAHRRAMPTGPKQPRPANWLASLTEAQVLRLQALQADPKRSDPAWGTSEHEQFMAFYKDKGL